MAVENIGTAKPAADEVLLITSGDLRLSANQVCWPAQRDMEEKLTAAFAQKGIKLVRAHAYDHALKHGFISSQRHGDGCLHEDTSRGAAGFCYSRLAVQPSCSARTAQPQGADSHCRQLVGPVAGAGGAAQSERLAGQGGKAFSSIWSKEFTDAYFTDCPRRVAARRQDHA